MPEKGHNMLHFPLSGYLHLHYAMFCVKYDFKNEVKHTLRGVATFGSNYIYLKKKKMVGKIRFNKPWEGWPLLGPAGGGGPPEQSL